MGCELDKVVEAINKVASEVRDPRAINQLNELKNDLNKFATSMETAKPTRDFSRLKSVMSNVEVKATTTKGGTGQAVEMARLKGIPTINMANSDWKEQLDKVLSSKSNIDKEEGPSGTTLVKESTVNSKKKDAIIAPINSQTARDIKGCNK